MRFICMLMFMSHDGNEDDYDGYETENNGAQQLLEILWIESQHPQTGVSTARHLLSRFGA